MRITDFEELIRHLPFEYQAFNVNPENWKDVGQTEIISKIFSGKESVTISRFDLFHSTWDLKSFVIKLLMWGYPTKGRGKNIENLLLPENFELLISKLSLAIEKKNISMQEVKELINGIKGIQLSTLSKILYFSRVNVESFPAMILDQRVINALNSDSKFQDIGIEKFKNLNYTNAINSYDDYLKFIFGLAIQMKVLPDQIEIFLFMFGTSLKELEGEDGDWSEL